MRTGAADVSSIAPEGKGLSSLYNSEVQGVGKEELTSLSFTICKMRMRGRWASEMSQ